MENRSPRKNQPNHYLKYSSLGFQMVGAMGLAAWGGMRLDEYFHVKTHLFTVFLLIFAVTGSLYLVIRDLLNGK